MAKAVVLAALLLAVVGTATVHLGACAASRPAPASPASSGESRETSATPGAVAGQAPLAAGLASWNPGAARDAVLDFLGRVTRPGEDFVPPAERIAVFDLDGTLWCEKPYYPNFWVAVERMRKQVEEDPSLAAGDGPDAVLYRAARDDELAVLRADPPGVHGLAFEGVDMRDYQRASRRMLRTRRHERFGRPLTALFYQPVRELMDLLRQNGFTVYVVSGSDQEFVRVVAADFLGLPPDQIIGSAVRFDFRFEDPGASFVRRRTWLLPRNKREGKAERIRERTGRWPVLAVGNSAGDLGMFQLVHANPRPGLALVIDHDDPEREYDYHHPELLEAAARHGWTVVSMQRDFRVVFAP